MHLLAISLLTILAGTLLLAKFKKENQEKIFRCISWFFIVVGFLLFLGFIAGGICKLKHHCFNRHHGFRYEMMGRVHGCGSPEMMGRGPGCGPGMMMGRGPGCGPMGMKEGGPGAETEIKESDLPKEVSASVAKNFAGFKISDVSKMDTPDKGVCYEMDVNNGKEGFEVTFSSKGDILSKHPLKKEEKEDKD
ncbi:MAG: hypothetical protein WCI48_12715 [Bacteroidota bacterium]|jgi:hypothetical protein